MFFHAIIVFTVGYCSFTLCTICEVSSCFHILTLLIVLKNGLLAKRERFSVRQVWTGPKAGQFYPKQKSFIWISSQSIGMHGSHWKKRYKKIASFLENIQALPVSSIILDRILCLIRKCYMWLYLNSFMEKKKSVILLTQSQASVMSLQDVSLPGDDLWFHSTHTTLCWCLTGIGYYINHTRALYFQLSFKTNQTPFEAIDVCNLKGPVHPHNNHLFIGGRV